MKINPDRKIILEGKNLTKKFYGNIVLDNVDIVCKEGIVLGLAGENGAGKTTLMNILCGNLQPDHGTIKYYGEEVNFLNPQIAREKGIAFVHQELSLIDYLSVGENIMLGQEPEKSWGLIDHKKLHQDAEKIIKELHYELNVLKLVGELSPAEKQMVEIAKAWSNHPDLLILDEPTSSLSKTEVKNLFKMIHKLQEEDTSIIFITHRIDEIFQICDEVVVLKDGQLMKTEKVVNINRDDLINSMVGRKIEQTFPGRREFKEDNCTILELENISLDERLKNINLKVPAGAIIGIGGLDGHGQRDLARGLYGIEPFTGGRMKYKGEYISLHSPSAAISKKIGFISDDRKTEGLILCLSLRENMTLLILDQISSYNIIQQEMEQKEVFKGINELDIKASSPEQEVNFLSGGNQQKVVFSRLIKMNPDLLVLHEPTRGVDIQSKIEIYHLLRDLTDKGIGIIIFTSDMLELIGLSDRIFVMYEGQITGKLDGKEATEEKIMRLSSGITLQT